ncbi:MAG: glycosyltransferase family 2 protein [Acidobacteriota bacterium]
MAASLSIVMPVYNERDVIERVISEIRAAGAGEMEIVAYDDGSKDGSGALLDELERRGWIRALHGDANRGYDAAVTAALRAARGDLIHLSDSDGQHDPRDLLKLLEVQRSEGADLVVGWKRPRRDPAARLVLSAGMNAICRWFFGSKLHDANCGFRVMTRDLRDAILPKVGKLPTFVSTECSVRAQAMGYRVREVVVTHRPRASGKSRSFPISKVPRILARVGRGFLALYRELHAR